MSITEHVNKQETGAQILLRYYHCYDYYRYCSLFRSSLEAKAKLTRLLIIAFMCFRKINGNVGFAASC